MPPTSRGPVGLVEPLTAAAFRAAARVRRARAFHPRGHAHTAQVLIDAGSAPDGFPTGEHAGIVRFSRGAGLPEVLPDVLGVAVRLVDAAGPRVHQDLLMASTGRAIVGRHLLRPGRWFDAGVFSTILPYDVRGRRVVFGARVTGGARIALDDAADHTVELLWTTPGASGWTVMGEVRAVAPLGADEEGRLGLDPFRTVPEVTPVGRLNQLRRPAYGASRQGRTGDGLAGSLPGRVES